MHPLINLLVRLASGERLRKATPEEMRYYGAFFLLIPVCGGLFMALGTSMLDKAGILVIWLWFTALGGSLVFGTFFLARYVQAKISWTVGAILWATVVCLALIGFI